MAERLTRKQMADKYPNQWLGIRNITYKGREIESAEVIYNAGYGFSAWSSGRDQ